jgi:PleD family two-component response regulator
MKKKIVLIETMSLIRSRLKQTLTENDFEVYEIREGKNILKAQKFNPSSTEPGILDVITPDLFILSLDIDDVDGIKILKILKMHEDFKDIPVIVNSNHNDKETIVTAIASGAADYVLKKENFVNTLLDKVQKYFEKGENTFEATLKRELDWVRYGKKELSFALIAVKRYSTGKAIDAGSLEKVLVTLKSKLRHYDWAFQLDEKRLAAILPVTTLKDVVILRNRVLELLQKLSDEIKLPMDIQIGFSHYPVNAKTAEELIALAEEQIEAT